MCQAINKNIIFYELYDFMVLLNFYNFTISYSQNIFPITVNRAFFFIERTPKCYTLQASWNLDLPLDTEATWIPYWYLTINMPKWALTLP